eukprot:CAMPEP_0168400594 /NCGR_PEP_ID=MMETSP0228-20121227/22678_1 /TAXON_ID=133427 /ORGANISM="Protoceratium reticulatum, Strain CCCM 535 (=CCMP 1889)" /LENGTH=79 /DNA_ID=CAMNT_0008414139 /DNA_START=89 /DNA_END=325 /DNA_ORIENTATION=-
MRRTTTITTAVAMAATAALRGGLTAASFGAEARDLLELPGRPPGNVAEGVVQGVRDRGALVLLARGRLPAHLPLRALGP